MHFIEEVVDGYTLLDGQSIQQVVHEFRRGVLRLCETI